MGHLYQGSAVWEYKTDIILAVSVGKWTNKIEYIVSNVPKRVIWSGQVIKQDKKIVDVKMKEANQNK